MLDNLFGNTTNLAVELGLTIKTCPSCYITYAAPTVMFDEIKKRGGNWHCPNGHSLHFTELEIDKLKRQLKQAKDNETYYRNRTEQEHQARKAAEHSANAYKGVATKLKNRVAKGVCPCCNRSFADLRKHMDSKHPEWSEEKIG